jgi:hypothetical protein
MPNKTPINHAPGGKEKIELITQNITVRSIDRSKKDVSTWRNAHISAESVTNPNRTRLYNVYEDVLLDGHLTGIIGKRLDTVLNKNLLFKKDRQVVAGMEKTINSKTFRDLITELLLSKMWGISGMEFVPGDTLSFRRIPRKHIKPHWGIIALEEHATQGISYSGLANVWIVGDPADLGLLLKCGFYALLKKGAITDWAEYIEVFGSPIMLMTYDAGDTQTDLALDKVLDNIGNSMRIKIPRQAGFDIKDGKASNGDGKLQETFRNAMNEEMSTIILGNTETTTSSSSSGYAQSSVHAEQQMQIIRSDMMYVLDYLNTPHFHNILRSYGLPIDGGSFVYDKEIDIAYMVQKIQVDKDLAAMGLPINHQYLYDTYSVTQEK